MSISPSSQRPIPKFGTGSPSQKTLAEKAFEYAGDKYLDVFKEGGDKCFSEDKKLQKFEAFYRDGVKDGWQKYQPPVKEKKTTGLSLSESVTSMITNLWKSPSGSRAPSPERKHLTPSNNYQGLSDAVFSSTPMAGSGTPPRIPASNSGDLRKHGTFPKNPTQGSSQNATKRSNSN